MKRIPNVLSSKIGRQTLIAAKHSPTLLFGVGVVGVVGTTVLACRATMKLGEVLDTAQHDLEVAREIEDANPEHKKDVTIIYVRNVVSIGKLYGPAVFLGCASISALTASHNILNKRNMALTAAYAAIDRGFGEYRGRVIEKYGEKQDQEFRYATEKVGVMNSKGKTVQETRVSPDAASIYARFFDQLCPSWNKESEYNLVFLDAQQCYVNNLLEARGHVMLNEVYEGLGIPHSSAGAVVGWVLGHGDGYIDFGIWDGNNGSRNFVNGREGAILLDFNVDGVVYNLIDDAKREAGRPWQS